MARTHAVYRKPRTRSTTRGRSSTATGADGPSIRPAPLPSALRDQSVSRPLSEGYKHVRIRSPTPGTPPPLDTIVGEASAQPGKMPILVESDDEWGGDQALEFPILGEAGDEGLPIVGELTRNNVEEHVPLAPPPVEEESEGDILESSFHRLEVSPTCRGTYSAPVPIQVQERNASVNAMDLKVLGEEWEIRSDCRRDSGMEGGESLGTYVADTMFQDPDAASPVELTLPVVGETSRDFGPLPGTSRSSCPCVLEDQNEFASEMELSESLLDMTPSPCMIDGVFPGVTIATPTEDGTVSPPLSPYSEEHEGTSPDVYDVETRTIVHQRLVHLRSKRQTISAAIELLEQAEVTARILQDSPFSTSPTYWRVYQISLLRRGPGVNSLWEDMQE